MTDQRELRDALGIPPEAHYVGGGNWVMDGVPPAYKIDEMDALPAEIHAREAVAHLRETYRRRLYQRKLVASGVCVGLCLLCWWGFLKTLSMISATALGFIP